MIHNRRLGLKPLGEFTTVLILSLSLPSPAGAQGLAGPRPLLTEPLTLREVVETALQKSPRLFAARERVNAASKGIGIAWGDRLPKIRFLGEASHFPANEKIIIPGFMFVPRREIPDQLNRINDVSFDDFVQRYNLAFSLPLFTGGRLTSQIRLAELGADAAEFQLNETENQLVLDLARAFYDILRLKKVVEANEKTVENLEENRRRVELQLQVGTAAQIDLFRINTRLANVRQRLIRARNELAIARARLNTLMGVEDITQPVEVTGPFEFIPTEYDLRQSIRTALENRPAYKAAKGKVEMTRKGLAIARSQYWPQISVGGYYGLTHGDFAANDVYRDDAAIVVSASFPIFDLSIPNQVGQASAQLHEAQEEFRQMELNVALEVQTAHLNLIEAGERVKVAEASLKEAEEALRIEQLKLETGKGVINDLLDAQAELLEAEVNDANALADHNTAHIALQKAVGMIELPR